MCSTGCTEIKTRVHTVTSTLPYILHTFLFTHSGQGAGVDVSEGFDARVKKEHYTAHAEDATWETMETE